MCLSRPLSLEDEIYEDVIDDFIVEQKLASHHTILVVHSLNIIDGEELSESHEEVCLDPPAR